MSRRIHKILQILLNENDFITINEIADRLDVSNKTIRNDLQLADEILAGREVRLEKKIGVGVAVSGSNEAKLHLLGDLSLSNPKTEIYSPQGRCYYIIKKLLDSEDGVRISLLARELFVSRATINKDLQFITTFLIQYKVRMIRSSGHGLLLEGSEKNKRKVLSRILLADSGAAIRPLLLHNTPDTTGKVVIPVYDLYDTDILELKNILFDIPEFTVQTISETMLMHVFIKIITAILRLQQNCRISLSDEFIAELKSRDYYDIARIICARLGAEYELDYPEEEIRYLQVYLISAYLKYEDSSENDIEAFILSRKLIASWENTLALPLSLDDQLQKSLSLHLNPALTRIKHGIVVNNQLLDDIKSEFRPVFDIVANSLRTISDLAEYRIEESEIGFITLHLTAALNRRLAPFKTLVVNNGGIGESALLVQSLKQFVSFIEIIDVKNINTLDEKAMNDIDLIITTIPLTAPPPHVILLTVNPILNTADLKRVNDIVLDLLDKKRIGENPYEFQNAD